MSLLPNGSVYMFEEARNGFPNNHQETFQNFFECWLKEQKQRLQALISASESYKQSSETNDVTGRESALHELINQVIHHYEHYYNAKSHWVKEDVISMLSPSWRTTLEDAFLWIGGWRPSMAFHLLYSKSGIQLEAALAEFLRGLPTADLGEFSPNQLIRVDELHLRTVGEEREITEKLARQHETVADPSMVELSHAVSEMMRDDESGSSSGIVDQERVDTVLQIDKLPQMAYQYRVSCQLSLELEPPQAPPVSRTPAIRVDIIQCALSFVNSLTELAAMFFPKNAVFTQLKGADSQIWMRPQRNLSASYLVVYTREKEKGFEEIMQIADELRMKTLKGVIEILSPIEAVHFLIAAAELHLRMHDWGKKKELEEDEVQPNGVEEEVQPNGVEVGRILNNN
ncbi:protein DOG1-like 3 [Impatiens glandulifera]|uniref:protein DOG1-like 3 n=1 Tax=Impatiens glandulifera TaxID=253017 RepID=UPI001FB0A30C|nr:protein DOG1-like 3 [Impatiens glandulifera]